MAAAKRQATAKAGRSTSMDKALRSAARWLKRRGARREKRETRQAYTDAASVIMNRLHK